VGAVFVEDPEDDALVYTLLTSSSMGPDSTATGMPCPVTLSPSGALTVYVHPGTAGLDHETSPTCNLTIRACEADTPQHLCAAVEVPVTVVIEDVNEAPSFVVASLVVNVSEHTVVGSVIGMLASVDPDAGDSASFEAAPVEDAGALALGPPRAAVLPGGAVVLQSALDAEAEPYFLLPVRVVDSGGLVATAVLNVTVEDANDPPVVTCGVASGVGLAASVQEHSIGLVATLPVTVTDGDATDVVQAVASDASNPGLSVTLLPTPSTPGPLAHVQRFVVGVTASTASLGPGPYWVVVGAVDSAGGTSAAVCNLTITIVNVNDPPSFVAPDAPFAAVPETSVASTVVAVLELEDPDEGQPLTCAVDAVVCTGVVDGALSVDALVADNGLFVASASGLRTCVLALAVPGLDAEVCTRYTVSLSVRDGALLGTQTMAVTVADELDAPVVTSVGVAWGGDLVAPAGSSTPSPVPSRALSTLGGDVVVVRGVSVGSATPGGLTKPPAGVVGLEYWDAAAVPVHVFHASECLVVEGGSGIAGEVRCVTVPGVGPVSSVRLSVYGQVSPVFPVGLKHAAPIVTSVDPPLLDTAGGESVRVNGTGFGPAGLPWSPSLHLGPLTLTGCTVVQDDTYAECVSVPTSAAQAPGDLVVGLEVAASRSSAPAMRLRSPCLASVSLQTPSGLGSTVGGDGVLLSGRHFGVAGTPVDFAVYGPGVALQAEGDVDNGTAVEGVPPLQALTGVLGGGSPARSIRPLHVATQCRVTVSHVTVACVTAPGVGSGHMWALGIGGAVSSLCSGSVVDDVTTGYAPPALVSLAVTGAGVDGGVVTEGGSFVTLTGTNLGTGVSALDATNVAVLVSGVAMGSVVVTSATSMTFVAPAGFGGGHVVVVEVGGQRSSGPGPVLRYAGPTVHSVAVLPGTTAATKLLRIAGLNMGAACVGCMTASQQPAACPASTCDTTSTLCGSGSLPVVTVHAAQDASSPVAGTPCEVLCVSGASAGVIAVTCRTTYPGSVGFVEVAVGGAVSPRVALDYDGLLSPPVLLEGSASPSRCPTQGCTVVVAGRNLASCELLVTNALGTSVVPPGPGDSSSISVRVFACLMPHGVLVRSVCLLCRVHLPPSLGVVT
jgi:hypothetical protein